MQPASYIPKSIDGTESVAQIQEKVQQQGDRSAIAYHFWLAVMVESRGPHTSQGTKPTIYDDLIYLKSSLWLCREDLHLQTNRTALVMIGIHTASTRTQFGAI